jgi:hypothetical protein
MFQEDFANACEIHTLGRSVKKGDTKLPFDTQYLAIYRRGRNIENGRSLANRAMARDFVEILQEVGMHLTLHLACGAKSAPLLVYIDPSCIMLSRLRVNVRE